MNDGKERNLSWKDFVSVTITSILFIAEIVICVFFFNWLGLLWLNLIGWVIIGIAFFVLGWLPRVAFTKYGQASKNKRWFHTTVVVDRGIYSVVRHPFYLSIYFYFIGLICISQYWLALVLAIPAFVMVYLGTLKEERANIKKFGSAYEDYMKRVPRLNILLGIFRIVRTN
jgi:protein-S-isoprenylcysteine O-methyltransferase Ste14